MEENKIDDMFDKLDLDDLQKEKIKLMSSCCKGLALLINLYLKDSREKSLALTKLQECNFWINDCIARNNK